MPGFSHEAITGLFKSMIDRQLFEMDVHDEIIPLGSPLVVLQNWTKEPNACWALDETGELTVVLEVGSSEPASRLSLDARAWLETPGTTVRACITIKLNRRTNGLVINVWEPERRSYTMSLGNSPQSAVQVQHVETFDGEAGPTIRGWKTDENSGFLSTDEIRLVFATIAGRSVSNLEHDIIINSGLLLKFANRFWRLHNWHLQGR